ncbi:retrovirus-related Pol polyprotein from transposon 412 [Trichonephila clavata]|uniref:Retrovirus-related Pol polyprotein from transposon 412 n=1 Tax=Trichonephila clavata TaxID=2740835 RepID=A0A8X6GNB4_TRICU|nr:retrovirus-related Pol polyprotein from transposon 412 [Trichonephila clavata]
MEQQIAELLRQKQELIRALQIRDHSSSQNWPAIKAIRAKTEQNLNNLLREYMDIFDDKLGEISNYEAKLKLRSGVKPIFCRVRTVPFALKGRVEKEIDRLEREGVIEKVESSLNGQPQ